MSLRKADRALRRALEQAAPDEVLRAVLQLVVQNSGGTDPPDPGDFPSRVAYREALIRRRYEALAGQIDPTTEALRRLDLSPQSMGSTPALVVIEGTAARIRSALRLPSVRHASLDRPLPVVAPHSPRIEDEPQTDADRYVRVAAALQVRRLAWPASAIEELAGAITDRLRRQCGPALWDALRHEQFGSVEYDEAKRALVQTAAQVGAEYCGDHGPATPPEPAGEAAGSPLNSLPPRSRDIVVRRTARCQGWEEIAQSHGLTAGQAQAIYRIAMARLARSLGDR